MEFSPVATKADLIALQADFINRLAGVSGAGLPVTGAVVGATLQRQVFTFGVGTGNGAVGAVAFGNTATNGLIFGVNTVSVVTNGVERWMVNASGAFNPILDNTYDIGNLLVNPRDIHVSRNVIFKVTGGGNNNLSFIAPAAANTLQYILPATDPTVGQVLRASAPAAGIVTLSWETPASKVIQSACSDETTPLTTGVKTTFRMPYAMTLTGVRASLTTAQAAGTIFTVDILEAGVSVLSTKITIDNTEKTSVTAAAPPVISDSALADDAEITVSIDQIGDGSATGLKISIIGT